MVSSKEVKMADEGNGHFNSTQHHFNLTDYVFSAVSTYAITPEIFSV